jgi:hypothetical protein
VPPALLVDFGFEAGWHPRRFAVVGGIAGRAERAWRPAAAGVVAAPRSLGMALAHPAAIFAKFAFHAHRDREGQNPTGKSR